MSEFAPGGGIPKMTKSQVKRYIKQMEEKRIKAKLKLEKAILAGKLNNDEDLDDLDKKIDNLF